MARYQELVGVYHADGSLLGEARYVVGKILGRAHCSLCDITHDMVRKDVLRKWVQAHCHLGWESLIRTTGGVVGGCTSTSVTSSCAEPPKVARHVWWAAPARGGRWCSMRRRWRPATRMLLLSKALCLLFCECAVL